MALQGAFKLHGPHLEKLPVSYRYVTKTEHLKECTGLIIPGGESTSMIKLLHHQKMIDSLRKFVMTKPTWGICAGLILLSRSVKKLQQLSFNALGISVVRNEQGRQICSCHAEINNYTVSFVRSPTIDTIDDDIKVLHRREGRPTWIESTFIMGTTFHPELNRNTPSPWHTRFATLFCGLNDVQKGP